MAYTKFNWSASRTDKMIITKGKQSNIWMSFALTYCKPMIAFGERAS